MYLYKEAEADWNLHKVVAYFAQVVAQTSFITPNHL